MSSGGGRGLAELFPAALYGDDPDPMAMDDGDEDYEVLPKPSLQQI